MLKHTSLNLAPTDDYHSGGSGPTTGDAGVLFKGPGYVKHLYILTQQDRYQV